MKIFSLVFVVSGLASVSVFAQTNHIQQVISAQMQVSRDEWVSLNGTHEHTVRCSDRIINHYFKE